MMKLLGRQSVAILTFASLFLLPTAAFAQAGTPPELSALTPSTVAMAIVAAVLAFVANAYNSGSFFGRAPVPQTWLPYFGMAVGFLGAGYASLYSAGGITTLSVANALLAGFFALLVGTSSGAAAHKAISDHIALPKMKIAALAAAAPKVVAVLAILALASTQSACLSSSPVVPVTPANQAQISQCESTATFHDAVVVGDIAVGGIGAVAAAGAASVPASNQGLQVGLGVAGAVAAALAAGGAGLAEVTAANFAANDCSAVVGALPAAKPAPAPVSLNLRMPELLYPPPVMASRGFVFTSDPAGAPTTTWGAQ